MMRRASDRLGAVTDRYVARPAWGGLWLRRLGGMTAVLLLASLLVACDAIAPEENDRLVLEAFFVAGQPVEAVQLRRTEPLRGSDAAPPVTDASVALVLGAEQRQFVEADGMPGRYVPAAPLQARAESAFTLEVQWNAEEVRTEGLIPPVIAIDSLRVRVPDRPVEAVMLDSLHLDSLGLDVEEGFIYPVEVDLWWPAAEEETEERWWVRTQLRPEADFSSAVVDFFLQEEDVFPEEEAQVEARARRRWTGLYAVRVESADAPLPVHRLRVALLRGDRDYARYVASRGDPTRREPHSNVEGALGIVAGIALDSTSVFVE